ERIASLLLLTDNSIKCKSYDLFKMGPSTTPLNQFYEESKNCDDLKISFDTQNDKAFMLESQKIQSRIFKDLGINYAK
ncbi:hypothetical protein, partial [Limnohabitans sp.]|uniref:hypothetical protein n=1 Tax=Limnohabitans sp. TaxID=1907725 RepID=UPI002FDD1627